MKKWILGLFLVTATILNAETKVLAFAGSTRADSYNKKLVSQAAQIAQDMGAAVTLIDLKDYPMPFYDADLEAASGMPENAKIVRQLMMENEVIFIASPQYNKSVSAVLKNLLDWVSRDEYANRSKDAYLGKKFALMSASTGKGGGASGLIHLRDIIEDERGIIIPQKVCVPIAHEAFDEQGMLKDTNLTNQLKQLVSTAILENK